MWSNQHEGVMHDSMLLVTIPVRHELLLGGRSVCQQDISIPASTQFKCLAAAHGDYLYIDTRLGFKPGN